MKVLLAHNFYRSSAPSGEDAVFRNERNLLEQHMEVSCFERYNDDLDISTLPRRLRLARDSVWSRSSYADLSGRIRRERPDLVHFHSIFPQISPSAYAACHDRGVPVVQTLHNYRFICPGALLQRDGHPCEDCVGTSLLPALRHRCYRDSLAATAVQALTIQAHRWRRTYRRNVDRYVALTRFAAGRLVAGGLPRERMEVKANFLPDPPPPGSGSGDHAVFIGRLTPEKGVHTLLRAWQRFPGMPLKIIGDGASRRELEEFAAHSGVPAEFLGSRRQAEFWPILGSARVLIFPSECYEGFPMVLLEAFAHGTPVLASRIGSVDEIVEEGVTGAKFEPGNAEDLADRLRHLLADPQRLRSMRAAARAVFEANYTAERNITAIRGIYDRAIQHFHASGANHR